jgi:hypothetical protein
LEGLNWFSRFRDRLDTKSKLVLSEDEGLENMYFTLKAAVNSLKSAKERSFGKIAEIVGAAAIKNAQGASGKVVADFLHGFSSGAWGKDRISANELALCFYEGARNTFQGSDALREGAIFGLTKNLAQDCLDMSRGKPSLIEVVKKAYDSASASLNTREDTALETAKVVDNDTKGFVYFLEGILKYNLGQLKRVQSRAKLISVLTPFGKISSDFCFRVEFVLETKNVDNGYLSTLLNSLGDSVSIEPNHNNQENRTKIVLRTQLPELVFDGVADLGKLLFIKVEDMAGNNNVGHAHQ